MLRLAPLRALLPLGFVALLVTLAAAPAMAAEISLTDEGFSPRTSRVAPGESIVWVNGTEDTHTVVGEDGTWDSGPLRPGETFSIAFREAGTFRYATEDGGVVGTVRVVAAAEDEADAEAASTDSDAAVAALPRTGATTLPLAGLALALLGLGYLCLERARSSFSP